MEIYQLSACILYPLKVYMKVLYYKQHDMVFAIRLFDR